MSSLQVLMMEEQPSVIIVMEMGTKAGIKIIYMYIRGQNNHVGNAIQLSKGLLLEAEALTIVLNVKNNTI